jgi:hypothetical protein
MVTNFEGHEPQPMPLNHEGHESLLDLNLAQLAKHKKLIGRKMHSQLEFEHITRPWHRRLGVNARSFVLVLMHVPLFWC